MKIGSLVKMKRLNGATRSGMYVGSANSNGYQYSLVLWFDEEQPRSVQTDLLEVINEAG